MWKHLRVQTGSQAKVPQFQEHAPSDPKTFHSTPPPAPLRYKGFNHSGPSCSRLHSSHSKALAGILKALTRHLLHLAHTSACTIPSAAKPLELSKQPRSLAERSESLLKGAGPLMSEERSQSQGCGLKQAVKAPGLTTPASTFKDV